MRALIYILGLIGACFLSACQPKSEPVPSPFVRKQFVQLSKPVAHYASTLFDKSMELRFDKTFENSVIRYTTDGTIPNQKDAIVQNPMVLTEGVNIRASAFHEEMQQSEMIAIDFLKAKKLDGVKSIAFATPPSEKYAGNGAMALLDFEKGTPNFRSDKWMGFDNKVVTVHIELKEPKAINSVMVSTISDNGAWIFLPKSIDVQSEKGTFEQSWDAPPKEVINRLAYLPVLLDGALTKTLEINIRQLEELPAWHAGAGGNPWFFIDEIIIQ